jgi:hypothetical protein
MKKHRVGRSKKWIQKVHLKKGALHHMLGVPEGENIPLGLLKEAAKEAGKLGHRARMALTMRGFRHHKGKR